LALEQATTGKPGPKVMRIGLVDFHAIKYGVSLAFPDV